MIPSRRARRPRVQRRASWDEVDYQYQDNWGNQGAQQYQPAAYAGNPYNQAARPQLLNEWLDVELEEAVDFGSRCDIKSLFAQKKRDPYGNWQTCWTDQKHKEDQLDEESQTRKEREAFAIVHRKELTKDGSESKTVAIDINSPQIKACLAKILEDHPWVNTKSKVMTFRPPFAPIVHNWDKVLEFESTIDDPATKKHYDLLKRTFEPYIEKYVEAIEAFEKSGHIEFELIPLAFRPGETVITKFRHNGNGWMAGIVRSIISYPYEAESPSIITEWELNVATVDWNGTKFGVAERKFYVYNWRKPTEAPEMLSVLPLRIHPESEAIKTKLIERGRIFESLKGTHFKAFKGTFNDFTKNLVASEDNLTQPLDRIIIDTHAYESFQNPPLPMKQLGGLDTLKTLKPSHEQVNPMLEIRTVPEKDKKIEVEPLTDEQCMLTPPEVEGFHLNSKNFCCIDIEGICDIEWNETAFESLVLDNDEKQLLLAFVNLKELKESKFDDFISGKGKGITILLCGPPGVGKTFTAESVAEQVKRPLYRIGAEDLGIDVKHLETQLSSILKRCAHWNAVLLIDEADVFLEARSPDQLERNELVSIFLRLLEYYSGIMILTTNRTMSLDTAFESRIDITLPYKSLDEAARAQVWRNFIKALPANSNGIDDESINDLAKRPLNGRQIKSAIKTALVLASQNEGVLRLSHLESVLKIREKATLTVGGSTDVDHA